MKLSSELLPGFAAEPGVKPLFRKSTPSGDDAPAETVLEDEVLKCEREAWRLHDTVIILRHGIERFFEKHKVHDHDGLALNNQFDAILGHVDDSLHCLAQRLNEVQCVVFRAETASVQDSDESGVIRSLQAKIKKLEAQEEVLVDTIARICNGGQSPNLDELLGGDGDAI